MRRLAHLLILLAALGAGPAIAEPSVPWMPSPAARHALELLVDEAGLPLPVSQWPLPRAAVMQALDALAHDLPAPLDVARALVAGELRAAEDASLSLALRGHAEALSGFGDEATPGSVLGVRSGTAAAPGYAMQIGARVDEGAVPSRSQPKLRLEDSAIAVRIGDLQLQAWAHRSWWGPGWQSSLLLGSNAPPAYGIGVQRAGTGRSSSPWLSWMGPWTYDLFVARNDDTMGSMLVGTRITMRPLTWLEIGLSRTAQWGGRGRPESLDSFVQMLVGLGVNVEDDAQTKDVANELSGIDLRLRCPLGVRCAVYGQFIGEDETNHLPTRFLGLYGLEGWSADGRHRWFAEFAETLCGAVLDHNPVRRCAYRNHSYPEGYAHAGRWLGSAAGADSRLLTVGWLDAAGGTSLRVHAGSIGARVGVFASETETAQAGPMRGLAARQSWRWGRATLGAELDWFTVHAQQGKVEEARLGMTVRMPF